LTLPLSGGSQMARGEVQNGNEDRGRTVGAGGWNSWRSLTPASLRKPIA
jgi:hypothetical protein